MSAGILYVRSAGVWNMGTPEQRYYRASVNDAQEKGGRIEEPTPRDLERAYGTEVAYVLMYVCLQLTITNIETYVFQLWNYK